MEGILNIISKYSNGAVAAIGSISNKSIKNIKREKQNQQQQVLETRTMLLEQIKEIKTQMSAIQCCFDLETNFDLIDSYILELDSLEKRYSYLIKQAKYQGVVAF